jgi:hypothetical protein
LFEKEGRTDDKGRSSWGRRGSVFMVTNPIDGQAATHANGGTIGFNFDSPEEVDAWHARGVAAGGQAIEDPPGYRENAFGKLYLAYCAIRTATSSGGLYRPATMSLSIVSEAKAHGGRQLIVNHASSATATDMTFSIYLPPQAVDAECAIVWYLSGLTCTQANVTEKGEYRAACARHGLIFVRADTSPRGESVPGDPAGGWDFGLGAGFYVDATEAPFDRHYRMWTYVTEELPALFGGGISGRTWRGRHHRPFDGRAWRADGGAAQSRPLPLGLGLRADRCAGPGAVGRESARRLSRR